jgi:hypothetical protein
MVLSCDGKGVAMRPDGLRPATAKAAAATEAKLDHRRSKGEKPNRKRMAEIAVVYDIAPVVRTPADILRPRDPHAPVPDAPKAANKWATASVVDDAATVIATMPKAATPTTAAGGLAWWTVPTTRSTASKPRPATVTSN